MLKKIVCLACAFMVFVAIAHAAGAVPKAPSGEQALAVLQKNNAAYVQAQNNTANISAKLRQDTATQGQNPYALILTCADSRVPPEHIFMAGLGELFVVRNAGNVLSSAALASMEYAVAHLGIKLIVVMGHGQCGAVGAALVSKDKDLGQSSSPLAQVVLGIQKNIQGEQEAPAAELKHVQAVVQEVQQSSSLQALLQEQQVLVRGAMYDVQTGKVRFIHP